MFNCILNIWKYPVGTDVMWGEPEGWLKGSQAALSEIHS